MVSPTSSPSSSATTVVPARCDPCHTGPSGSLPLRSDPLQSGITSTVNEEQLEDSGYGSHDSTQAATEETGIELRISKSKTIVYFPAKLNEAQLERFHNIKPSIERLLVQHVTRKSLLRASARYKPMIIRPMFLGKTLLDAGPHIVVFCAPEMRKRIQQFLDTNELIKACCKDDSRHCLSTFRVTVCGCAPQLRADGLSVDVIWESYPEKSPSVIEYKAQDPQLEVRTPEPFAAISISAPQRSAGCVTCRERSIVRGEIPSYCDCTITRLEYEDYKGYGSRSASSSRALRQSFSGTETRLEAGVCGTAIQFRANGKQSNATLGGIVKLVYKNGSFDLKGLTVAHAAVACLNDESLGDSALSISSCEDEDDDNDSSMDEDWDSNNKNSEDAHMLDLGNERSTHKSRKQHDPWVFENPHTIGEACLAQSMLSTLKGEHTEDGSFFDWALTPLSVAKINQLADTAYQQGSRLIRKIRQFALHATWFSSEPVVIMCGSSVKRGRLVPEPSRILISPGLGFVTAYMIELSGQGVLSDGDSGSWVISEYTQDLLGHIVATDALGTGYFIPAEDIFNDIVRNRLAVAVTLPTVHDFRLKKNEAQGGMNGMETKGRHSSSKGKQASLLPYLDGPELFYKDGIKFPCLDNIKSLNGVIGNAIFQSKHENSANASDAGKEMVGYDSDESLKQLTSTSIERGMRGLDVVVITTGSRRFRSVVNAIAASGGYEGIRFTSVSDQIIDKSCHYAFQFPGSSSARDAVRVFRCLLADVESGVSLKNLGLDKGSDPSQQSATKISDVFHLGTGSQEISSIYVSPGLHTPFHHRYTGHLSSIAEVSVSKLLGSMDISGQQDEVPISDAPKHQQELQSS